MSKALRIKDMQLLFGKTESEAKLLQSEFIKENPDYISGGMMKTNYMGDDGLTQLGYSAIVVSGE